MEVVVEPKSELKHFIRRYNWQGKGRVQLPIRIMTLTESKMLYPDIPHSWLCDGKLLRLSDPQCSQNYKIFQVCEILAFCNLLSSSSSHSYWGSICMDSSKTFCVN